jgi:predicted outer membrane repeat protein
MNLFYRGILKTRLYFLFAIAFIFAHTNSYSQRLTVAGDVFGLWEEDTVAVSGHINIPEGQELLITPGVVVEFLGPYMFTVQGQIQALGSWDQPIVFSVADTLGFHDIFSEAGAWKGIYFIHPEGEVEPVLSGIFEHCYFEFAKSSQGDSLLHGGAVYIDGLGTYRFSDCRFENNMSFLSGGAVYFTNASPLFERCHFVGNIAGHPQPQDESYGYGGALCGVHSKGAVIDCYFSENFSTGIGGGLSFEYSSPVILNNVFEMNASALGGAFSILRSSSMNTIANNLIVNNEAQFFGGGIALLTTTATFSNNTIAGNVAAYGGGLYCNESSFPLVYNSILWGNVSLAEYGNQVYAWDAASLPEFFHCIIEGGIEDIWSVAFTDECDPCIDQDPLFLETGDHPWALQATSPGIMAGTPDAGFLYLPETDLAGNPRITNDIIDLGAYELDSVFTTNVVPVHANFPEVHIFPNPATQGTKVEILLQQSKKVEINLFNLSGRVIWHMSSGFPEPGLYSFELPADLAKGTQLLYLVVQSNGQRKAYPLLWLGD